MKITCLSKKSKSDSYCSSAFTKISWLRAFKSGIGSFSTGSTIPFRSKRTLAVFSGLALTASFAPFQLDWISWFALVPLLKSLEGESPSRSFSLGFIAGLTHYLTLLYWIVPTLQNYGQLPVSVSIGVLALFCLYLALYMALFSYLISRIKNSHFLVFLIPCLWVSLELIRATALTGFPWCLLGHTQFNRLGLIQIADLVGVYGISFLIVLANALSYRLFFDRISPIKRRLGWEALGFMILIVSALGYGQYRLVEDSKARGEGKTIKVAIIQGNIDQAVKWEPTYREETIDTYRRLTLSTSDFNPDLVVWPETAVPFFFQDNEPLSDQVLEITSETGAALIFGSPAYQRGMNGVKYFNRVYLISGKGQLSGYYDKHHLVPFGEYVPLKRFLPFIHRLVQATGDFASGDKVEPLDIPHLSSGVLICFEVIFPELARTQTRRGADVLVNLTNDAWYGKTSAPYQHLSMAVFRAVENKRSLIRAANTGFSALISARGKVIERSELFEEQVLTQEIEPGFDPLTFYTRYGDLFAFALLAISLIMIFHILWYNRAKTRVQSSTLPSAVSSGRTELRPKGGPGFGLPRRVKGDRTKT
jgi:apolipoprotein N-acyltransferase